MSMSVAVDKWSVLRIVLEVFVSIISWGKESCIIHHVLEDFLDGSA
jgi:hypothetical protein